ncbi:MAG: DMT family transporter [Phycisphaerae bacterium]|nr:DMT family transporter [Phycisphaerae bacterium]
MDILLQVKIGPLAALMTAMCWMITALCFEYSSKKIGSLSVNLIRLYLAFVLFAVFSFIFRGIALPTDATSHGWIWLGLSGLVGFVLGDLFLFKAFVMIGSRTSMLVMSLAPLVTALIGFLILDETLKVHHCIGMTMTTTGVMAVILTRKDGGKDFKHPRKGIIYASIGMIGQAVGLVLSKYGMEEYNAFSATHIRIIAGLIGFTILFFHFRAWGQFAAAFKSKRAMIFLVVGTVFGPFLGVYLSLVAVQHTSTGIASTIISIVPVLIIPFAVLMFKEKVNLREIIGAVIAVIGTGIMFL